MFYFTERKYMIALLLADKKKLVVPHGKKPDHYEKLIEGKQGSAAKSSSAGPGSGFGGQGLAGAVIEGDEANAMVKKVPRKSYYVPTGKPKGRPRKNLDAVQETADVNGEIEAEVQEQKPKKKPRLMEESVQQPQEDLDLIDMETLLEEVRGLTNSSLELG